MTALAPGTDLESLAEQLELKVMAVEARDEIPEVEAFLKARGFTEEEIRSPVAPEDIGDDPEPDAEDADDSELGTELWGAPEEASPSADMQNQPTTVQPPEDSAIEGEERPEGKSELDRSPKKNWVERAGGLPRYIVRIAKHLLRKGMTMSHAIATAINAVKKMCLTGDLNWPGLQNVNLGSKAQACAAYAKWKSMTARN
jgi:hypothetical protein